MIFIKDKPETLSVRVTVPNRIFLEELKLYHRSEGISEVLRKILHNAEELFRFGIDIHDVHTIEKIRKQYE